jgi:hypothetical protein
MSQLSATQTHDQCACNDADVDCITVGNSPSYHAATLFDTGAHTSFVNRDLAAWIEQQAKGDTQYAGRRRTESQAAITQVSLAGTSQTSAVLGNVVFDITFLNKVTQSHETLRNIHTQVIDSCIVVIISRPVIRENHMVHRIPLYFDEGTRSY